MRLGIICSSGASIIFDNLNFYKKNNINFFFIFDRECEALEKCKINNIDFVKIEFDKSFFKKTSRIFKNKKIKFIITLITRIVDENIYDKFKTYNLHPSYLPNYPGLNVLRRQIENKEILIGATLHKVIKKLDSGKVIFQIKSKYNSKNYKTVSFLQKTFLMMLLTEYLKNKQALNDKNILKIKNEFKIFQKKYLINIFKL